MDSRDSNKPTVPGSDEETAEDGSGRNERLAILRGAPALLGICGGIILVLVGLALVLNVTDDETGDAPPPEATDEVALETEVPDQEETIEPPLSTERPATEEGDNRRGPDDTATPDAALSGVATENAAATEAARRSIASSCPERCLIRIPASEDSAETLATAGTRASWTGGSWTWTVATRDGISAVEANAEATLVTKTAETVRLHIVVMPDEEEDDSLVEQFGTILDAVDQYRLVEVESVPAVVTPLTDNGYFVEKILPAPPAEIVTPEEPISLAGIDIGSLMDEVSSENLERSILDLQATSSTDGSGVGTRYYSAPGNVIAAEYLVQRLENYGLRVWYEDFLTPEGFLLVNVVGEVPGRDPSAIYGVLAHYDTMSTDPGNSPGADDNATGIAASLEIARVLSGYELEHPVRIIFVSAEEVGIIGADQFARRAVSEGTPYEGIFNIDSVGSDRQGQLMVLNADSSSVWMQELIVRINDAYGLGQELIVRQNPVIVADDNKLRDQGLEAVMVARELYGWSPVHHSPDDLIEYVSIPNTATTTTLILLSVATLVQE
jgi:hypothetical protein